MRLKESFITYETEDDYVLVAVDNQTFSGIVHLNAVAAFIVESLKEDITEEKIINNILDKYEVDKKRATNDVKNVIKKLKSIGAIDE